jgi:hypothetical protein
MTPPFHSVELAHPQLRTLPNTLLVSTLNIVKSQKGSIEALNYLIVTSNYTICFIMDYTIINNYLITTEKRNVTMDKIKWYNIYHQVFCSIFCRSQATPSVGNVPPIWSQPNVFNTK